MRSVSVFWSWSAWPTLRSFLYSCLPTCRHVRRLIPQLKYLQSLASPVSTYRGDKGVEWCHVDSCSWTGKKARTALLWAEAGVGMTGTHTSPSIRRLSETSPMMRQDTGFCSELDLMHFRASVATAAVGGDGELWLRIGSWVARALLGLGSCVEDRWSIRA